MPLYSESELDKYDATETQVCISCKFPKPLSDFRIDNNYLTKVRHRSDCKKCESLNARVVKKIKETAPQKPDECELCHRVDTKLLPDHNHDTEKFRGWIDNRCNRAIATLGDNLKGVVQAVRYLASKDYEGAIRKKILKHVDAIEKLLKEHNG